ncbi:MAG: hypothetical protein KDK28_11295 [Maritimibacter sp.]|nr:hypothetical protein [Maritimibacter sp.]
MTPSRLFMNAYAWASLVVVVVGIGWTLVYPPQSLRTDRDGVPHFTPEVEHMVTGEPVPMNELIRHYRGE